MSVAVSALVFPRTVTIFFSMGSHTPYGVSYQVDFEHLALYKCCMNNHASPMFFILGMAS